MAKQHAVPSPARGTQGGPRLGSPRVLPGSGLRKPCLLPVLSLEQCLVTHPFIAVGPPMLTTHARFCLSNPGEFPLPANRSPTETEVRFPLGINPPPPCCLLRALQTPNTPFVYQRSAYSSEAVRSEEQRLGTRPGRGRAILTPRREPERTFTGHCR